MRNTLVILLGATGVGKTELSLRIAEHFHSPIISADSRQLYKDLPIGTAAPPACLMQKVKHYMVGMLELSDYYSAGRFEAEVVALLKKLHATHPVVLMAGGSMLYINAVCNGIDDIPPIPASVREAVYSRYEREGLASILEELKTFDPAHYEAVDRQNPKRVLHAVEVIRTTGKPYSAFRTHIRKQRPFDILKIGLVRDRAELYERINRRVDRMMAEGFLEEARRVYPYRHFNALNTVGYKELFGYLDGQWTLDFAVEKIKQRTRLYARKQMTWFKRDKEIRWFHPSEASAIIACIDRFVYFCNHAKAKITATE
ncbi:MAG: tRNA dimethylallyltransferase 1 [Bacteroidales bacterium]